MKGIWRKREAFTLIEVLLALSLMASIISLSLSLIYSTSRAFSLEDDLFTTSQSGEMAMEFMTNHLRMGWDVVIEEDSGGSQRITFFGYYQGDESLLSFSRYRSQGEWVLGFRVDDGVRRPLVNGVERLGFERDEGAIVVILALVDKRNRESSFFSRVAPRKEAGH